MSTATRPRVLVLDADGQAGRAVVRSLGRRGVRVTAGSPKRYSLGALSRYSEDSLVLPDPAEDAEGFLDALRSSLESTDYFAVVPVVDRTSVLVARNKPSLAETGTVVATEDPETFERVNDKGLLAELAEGLSVRSPRTLDPDGFDAVDAAAESFPYPALVKPRSKTLVDTAGHSHAVTVDDDCYVNSPAELRATYRRALSELPDVPDRYPLVQAVVPGRTRTTVVLADAGEISAYFQEERVRTIPASGGNSTLLRGIDDDRMLAHAREVIGALEWTGPAMVEFIYTPEDGYSLIEVNGRYWGSVPFAIASGVDFPWLHFQQLRGAEIGPQSDYRTDLLFQRLFYEDLRWLGERLTAREFDAVPRFLSDTLAARQTFVNADDPLPTAWSVWLALALGAETAIEGVRRALSGRRSRPAGR